MKLYQTADPVRYSRSMTIERRDTFLLEGMFQLGTISPSWSIHAGVGTQHDAFCWGTSGENQAYDDVDVVTVAELR